MTFKEVSRKSSSPRSCLELALEAERVCKTTRDYQTAIHLFRQALAVGTDDITVLSAIYSQLGNAYFYEHDFLHALEFHRWDLSLSRYPHFFVSFPSRYRQTGDLHGEAKACANLSTCFKMIEKYPEAVLCALIRYSLPYFRFYQAAIARALHNLGNAYHAKGRQFLQFSGTDQLGEFTSEENLSLVCKLGDRPAEGRAYGNLGNTYYLLGNFRESVDFHKKRLQIAKEFGDLRAQRRAYSNLGNAYIFLADFTSAARSYKHALGVARQLGDEALQAQACFSLGHSCTLLRDYSAAVVYYLRHLHVAWEAGDRVGQGRCHWSLANVYAALGDYRRALRSSMRHRKISKELNDEIGLLAADLMIAELHQILGHSQPDPRLEETPPSSPSAVTTTSPHLQAAAEARALEQVLLFDADSCGQGHVLTVSPSTAVTIATTNPYVESPSPTVVEVAREEVEELSEKELVTELSLATNAALAVQRRHGSGSGSGAGGGGGGGESEFLSLSEEEEEDFVVVVSPTETESSGEHHRSGGNSVGEALHQATNQSNHGADQSDSSELLFDLLFKSQALRMNDQRCDLNALASSNVINNNNNSSGGGNIGSDGNSMLAASGDSLNAENDSFLDLLIHLQGARMNDQRADFPGLIRTNSVSNPPHTGPASNAAITTITAPQRNTSYAAVVETTPLTTNGGGSDGGSVTLAARMRSASDGLAEAEQAPSAADELAPGDDFFDMIFRLQQKTRINDQRSVLPPTLQTHNHHHTNYRDRHQDSNSGNNNNNEGATATGCHDGGGATAPHRLLRVLSVPGGKRRRRGGGGAGSGSSSSKAAVA
ncbi:G protein signaling modulator 2 [Echinococcus multilocularis]|uniref:G protein signaling modulator 2 n=1 Tax=Echinococcus multilocularis TaxID=6211 RepID=A0A068Y7G8_ECHMU|nr:G protein signaling modulator 2 [Echinococcus multilocularis]